MQPGAIPKATEEPVRTGTVVAEENRFCARCQQPVGRGGGDEPARTEGFCPNCGQRFDFSSSPPAVIAGRYQVKRKLGAAVYGGARGALFTRFDQAAKGMTTGRCQLEHGALSATGLTSTAGYSYVVLPSASGPAAPVMVSGDFMGLFTGNPDARRFLAFLASDQAQTLWVRQAGGHAFSADSAVPPSAYPPGAQQKIAALLQPSAGTALCFAAGDMMVPDMSTAFGQAALEYINDPSTLADLLAGLQKTQRGAGPSPGAKLACAQP